MTELPRTVERYLDALGYRLLRVLGDNLVGTYLHGSATLGGFNPDRSDIDVLVVVHHGLSLGDRAQLESELDDQSLPVPAGTLEMSIVTLESVQTPIANPSYEMHVNTSDARFANGQGRTDPDLVLHLPVVYQSGRLVGPGLPPKEVLAPVPRPLVLRAMANELVDALDSSSATPEYIVLNACRNLAYLCANHFYSKIDGGKWVLDHQADFDAQLVEASMSRQDGSDPTAKLDATAMRRAVKGIIRELTDEASRLEGSR